MKVSQVSGWPAETTGGKWPGCFILSAAAADGPPSSLPCETGPGAGPAQGQTMDLEAVSELNGVIPFHHSTYKTKEMIAKNQYIHIYSTPNKPYHQFMVLCFKILLGIPISVNK